MKNWVKVEVELEGKLEKDIQGVFVKVINLSLMSILRLVLDRRFFIRFKENHEKNHCRPN